MQFKGIGGVGGEVSRVQVGGVEYRWGGEGVSLGSE